MTRLLPVYVGVAVTVFLSSLDQTAVVTALPLIVSDIGGFSSYSWAITAYVLAMTVVVPVYGKLVDVYGARRLLLGATAIFVGGSALCAIAQGMTELVLFRVLQGFGGGGLIPVALATLARMVAPRDRGRYVAVAGAVIACAAIAGPTVGGALADGPGWRWIFLLNVPCGAVAFAAIWLLMARDGGGVARVVDWPGALLVAGASGLFLLGLVWGGHEYAWSSPQVVAAFVASAVVLVVLVVFERRARDPILPFALLRRRGVAVGVVALALLSMSMLGTVVFVPLFAQGVVRVSALDAGALIAPFMVSAVVASIVAGQIAARTGRYKASIVVGLAVLTGGLALVWQMDAGTSPWELAVNAAVAGIGLGLGMQMLLVSAQNASPLEDMGGSTALLHFARSLGGALGVTAMAVIAARDLPKGLDLRGPVPNELPRTLAPALADALQPAFLFAFCVAIVTLVFVLLFLREDPLRAGVDPQAAPIRSGS
jgi:EmrB/QacA subfamily drug resistance transporter